MKTANDMIREIADALGNECTLTDAERIWKAIRAADLETWDDRNGYSLPDSVDLLRVAGDALSRTDA